MNKEDVDFINNWKLFEHVYDEIAGCQGAMAEDIKTPSELYSVISEYVQQGYVIWDGFKQKYVVTRKGKEFGEVTQNDLVDDVTDNADENVKLFEQHHPHLSAEFKRIQQDQYKTFCEKMLSYGLYNISVGTNLETEQEKHLSLTGIWFRMNDKIQRLKQLLLLKNDNPLENEPVEDAWKDLSVYAIISQIVNNGKWINRTKS